jgi:uncharacterized membrane protein YkvA (DUF1232 family)
MTENDPTNHPTPELTSELTPHFSDDLTDDEIAESVSYSAELAAEIHPDRANRFYDRIRNSIHDYLAKKENVAGAAGRFLLVVPDMFMLLWRLLRDPRVVGRDKVLVGSAVVYFFSPFDLIPEAFMGPMGFVDDLVFGVFVVNKLLADTDPQVVREHWSGSEDVLQMLRRVTAGADNLLGTRLTDRLRKMVR